VTASIGITVFPQDASEADTLLSHADQAMYEAKRKRSGKSEYCLYEPKTKQESVSENLNLL
jgi:GGDEF domain-containing protein